MRLPRPARALMRRYEGSLARSCAAVVTVNDAVARELGRRYGVNPTVVLNCPPFRDIRRPGAMRTRLGLESRPVLLYHGALSPGRGIEATIAALRRLPPEVAFVILGNGSLAPALLKQRDEPGLAGRLHLHPAVPPRDLLSWVVDADLAMVLIEASELNFRLSTPNKLFEAMTSGVPVIASPLPALRSVVESERIGSLADPADIDGVARAVDRLLSDPAGLRRAGERARVAARASYNWERQGRRLVELYDRILIRSQEPPRAARRLAGGPPPGRGYAGRR